ncbi:MAG TPA: DUF805 domain-containing protein [Sphingomicrobium sp.]
MDWALRPLKHYAEFDGRSPRSEYWWFFLLQLALWTIALVPLLVAIGTAEQSAEPGAGFWIFLVLAVVLALGLFIPSLAVQVRRLHDQDLSGWLVLLFFIPYVGGIIAIVFMCIRGTSGPNRFGPDPFTEEHLEGVFA